MIFVDAYMMITCQYMMRELSTTDRDTTEKGFSYQYMRTGAC